MSAQANPTNSAPSLRFVLRENPSPYGAAKILLDSPERISDYFKNTLSTDENFESNKEHIFVIAVDSRLRVIGYNIVSVGTINQANCHPREILRPVIVAGAYGFVMIHNHPSGDPSPSRADEQVTRRILEASTLMQIQFLDHVICGEPAPGRCAYHSFREAGLI